MTTWYVPRVDNPTAPTLAGWVVLPEVAFDGQYTSLTGLPTLGSAAATSASAYATSAQGATADSSVQPAALAAKQDALVSGTNIKTINGSTVLGSGNLTVSAADPTYTPGSFTVATGTGRMFIKRMHLSTTQRATVTGNARLRIA